VAAIPGTGVLFTVSTAVRDGSWQGLIAAAGCTLGIVPHLIAAAVGPPA
jgi:threonine/homoserine/homoserine lactone efflux protein